MHICNGGHHRTRFQIEIAGDSPVLQLPFLRDQAVLGHEGRQYLRPGADQKGDRVLLTGDQPSGQVQFSARIIEFAGLRSIHEYFCAALNQIGNQQNPASFPGGGHRDGAPVPGAVEIGRIQLVQCKRREIKFHSVWI